MLNVPSIYTSNWDLAYYWTQRRTRDRRDEMMGREEQVRWGRAHYFAIVPSVPLARIILRGRSAHNNAALGHFAPGIRRQIDFRMSASFIFFQAPCVLYGSLYATHDPPKIWWWKLWLNKVLFLGSEKVFTNWSRVRFFVRWVGHVILRSKALLLPPPPKYTYCDLKIYFWGFHHTEWKGWYCTQDGITIRIGQTRVKNRPLRQKTTCLLT